MTMKIAISGKGGTGKSTLAALITRCLTEQAQGAVLAVDADPNACLGMMLGVESAAAVADLREDAMKQTAATSGSMGRLEAFEYGCHELLTEAKGFDLLAMGRPEGPKCYCAVNHVLRKFLDELTPSYGYVLTDNEAGMEHLSRRTTNDVDWLLIVGEPTVVGQITAKRITALAGDLPIKVGKIGVIWNKADAPPAAEGIETLACIPNDESIMDAAVQGKTVFELDNDCPALSAVRNMLHENMGIK